MLGVACRILARPDAEGLHLRPGDQLVRNKQIVSPGLSTFAILVLSIAMLALRRVGYRVYALSCRKGFLGLATKGALYIASKRLQSFQWRAKLLDKSGRALSASLW